MKGLLKVGLHNRRENDIVVSTQAATPQKKEVR
jgi:hypothetical protein